MMDALRITSVLLAACLLSVTAAAVQTPDTCDTPGKYCFGGDTLYECVNGKPKLIEYCGSGALCRDEKCVAQQLAPSRTYEPPQAPAPILNSDNTIILAVVIFLVAIGVLYFHIKRRR